MAAEISEKSTPSPDHGASARTSSHGDSTVANDVPIAGENPTMTEKVALETTEAEPLDEKAAKKKKKKEKKEKKEKTPKPEEVVEDPDEPFRHLPEHQAEILKQQVLTPDLKKGMAVLYRFSSRADIIFMIVGAICSICNGAALPLMTLIFGGLQKTFSQYAAGITSSSRLSSELGKYVLYFVYLALGQFVVTYIATVAFIYTGENISAKIRQKYLERCIRQNIGYFDKIGAGEIITRITSDTNIIQDGISEKVSLTISAISTFVTAFVIAFATYWKLTLILMSVFPAILLNTTLFSGFLIKHSQGSLESYAVGGTLTDEVLGSIRNSVAFGTQDRLAKQYANHLKKGEYHGVRVKGAVGIMIAGIMSLLFFSYALGFWQGTAFLLRHEMSLNEVLVVMMTVILGAFNMGNMSPSLQAFNAAVSAASKIFNTIDRISPIDPGSDEGETLENVQGNIRLEGIKHIYPSRPGVVVMDNVSLDIPAGKTTALVGASGSGKSTIVGLIERFYNPVEGTIYLDGHDISKLNIRWLRRQMALVSQEPTLFGTTVYENIRHGLIGTAHENDTEEQQRELIIEAAKKSNAHDFVSALPDGYETHVGDKGFLMSGGQKQRIAIARAIVSDPKILLLDEATSALDTKSEGVVQAALEVASKGRTTITIAHRLSTIKDAENIVVLAAGQILEQGTHDQLVENQSTYYKLVSAQNIASSRSLSAEEEELINQKQEMLIRKQSIVPADPDDDIAAKLKRSSTHKSMASFANQQHETEDAKKDTLWTLIKFIGSFNRTEKKRMIAGLICCIICGGGNPTSSVFFAKQITTLTDSLKPDSDYGHIKHVANFYCVMFVMLAIVLFLAYAGHGIFFAICSERLVHRIRDRAFRSMLRQDISFFDQRENTSGALTAFLSTETNDIAGMSGATLGTILLTLSTLISSVAVSLAIGWKLALVCTSTIPVMLACGFFRFHLLSHFQARAKEAYAQSAAYASEAISAIRTVASLTREEDIMRVYREEIATQQKKSLKSISQSSAVFGASQGAVFLCFGLGFWYGGTLLATNEYNLFEFFLCFMAIIYGAQSAGSIFSFAPDMGKAHAAAQKLKTLFERVPTVDAWSEEGTHISGSTVQGTLEFRDVHFRYPTRLEQPVLRGLDLKVQPGQYIALVGASGCGKSTTISLLERFYDPLAGTILLDGQDIKSLHIADYRSCIALVSQEPTLYQGTIKENILLGTSEENVSDETLEFACREANIYDFIISLPDGFNTTVGSKGTLLSGGQKQRVAIARALIRNPKILLLDEATSALDSESEFVVQAALDKAAKGRTTIAVAHRLSTIQKADAIFVFDKGRVVESGTHADLMKMNGRYAELVNLQSLQGHQ